MGSAAQPLPRGAHTRGWGHTPGVSWPAARRASVVRAAYHLVLLALLRSAAAGLACGPQDDPVACPAALTAVASLVADGALAPEWLLVDHRLAQATTNTFMGAPTTPELTLAQAVAGNATTKPLQLCYTYVGSTSCTPDRISRNQSLGFYTIDTFTLRKYQKYLYLPLLSYNISAASVAALAAAQLTALTLTVQLPMVTYDCPGSNAGPLPPGATANSFQQISSTDAQGVTRRCYVSAEARPDEYQPPPKQAFPSWVCNLPSLKSLAVRGGVAGTLPDCLATNLSLTSLDLSDNFELHGPIPAGLLSLAGLISAPAAPAPQVTTNVINPIPSGGGITATPSFASQFGITSYYSRLSIVGTSLTASPSASQCAAANISGWINAQAAKLFSDGVTYGALGRGNYPLTSSSSGTWAQYYTNGGAQSFTYGPIRHVLHEFSVPWTSTVVHPGQVNLAVDPNVRTYAGPPGVSFVVVPDASLALTAPPVTTDAPFTFFSTVTVGSSIPVVPAPTQLYTYTDTVTRGLTFEMDSVLWSAACALTGGADTTSAPTWGSYRPGCRFTGADSWVCVPAASGCGFSCGYSYQAAVQSWLNSSTVFDALPLPPQPSFTSGTAVGTALLLFYGAFTTMFVAGILLARRRSARALLSSPLSAKADDAAADEEDAEPPRCSVANAKRTAHKVDEWASKGWKLRLRMASYGTLELWSQVQAALFMLQLTYDLGWSDPRILTGTLCTPDNFAPTVSLAAASPFTTPGGDVRFMPPVNLTAPDDICTPRMASYLSYCGVIPPLADGLSPDFSIEGCPAGCGNWGATLGPLVGTGAAFVNMPSTLLWYWDEAVYNGAQRVYADNLGGAMSRVLDPACSYAQGRCADAYEGACTARIMVIAAAPARAELRASTILAASAGNIKSCVFFYSLALPVVVIFCLVSFLKLCEVYDAILLLTHEKVGSADFWATLATLPALGPMVCLVAPESRLVAAKEAMEEEHEANEANLLNRAFALVPRAALKRRVRPGLWLPPGVPAERAASRTLSEQLSFALGLPLRPRIVRAAYSDVSCLLMPFMAMLHVAAAALTLLIMAPCAMALCFYNFAIYSDKDVVFRYVDDVPNTVFSVAYLYYAQGADTASVLNLVSSVLLLAHSMLYDVLPYIRETWARVKAVLMCRWASLMSDKDDDKDGKPAQEEPAVDPLEGLTPREARLILFAGPFWNAVPCIFGILLFLVLPVMVVQPEPEADEPVDEGDAAPAAEKPAAEEAAAPDAEEAAASV